MDEHSVTELERFVAEIREVFDDAPEFDTIREINQYMAQIEILFNARQGGYAQSMSEISEGIQKLQKESDSLGSNEFQLKNRDLEEKKMRCEEKIAQLSKDRLQTAQLIEKYRGQCAELEKKKEEFEVESSDDIPRCRHALDLYMQLSSIKFNYDAPPQLLSGTIFLPDRVKQFEYNKDTLSAFDQVNKLWELLDS